MAKYEDGSYGSAAGIALIAKVLAGRCAMKYTRVAVGKGNIPDDKTPKTMTEPADYVMDAVIAGITNPVDGECQVTVQINSANVDKGFYCTAVVLYAEDPDEGEVPYTYLVLENEPEWIRPASSIVGKLATIDLIAAVGDVDTVTAAIDPEAIATVAAVNDLLQRHNEDPEAHAGIIMDAVGSAMKKLEESGQIMDQKTVETMIRKEIAEHGSGGYYGTYFLTLAASGWEQADEESPDYSYIYTAELPDSTSALIPSGAPLLGSFHIAEDAGVVNGCETGDLARATGIRPTTISDYYNEIAERMNLNHLDLICEALDCSPTEILVREPNPEPRVRNRTGFEKPVTGQRKDGE